MALHASPPQPRRQLSRGLARRDAPAPHEQPWHTRALNLPTPGAWGHLVDQFLDSADLSIATAYYYKRILSKLAVTFSDQNPTSLTPLDLHTFIAALTKNKSASTKCTTITVVKRFYQWLWEMDLIANNPAMRLKRPSKPKPEPRYLDQEDVNALMRAIAYRRDLCFLSVVALAAYAGLRRGSIHALKWENVNLQERTITVLYAKGGKHYTVPMADKLHHILATWKQASADNDCGYVIAHVWKGKWKPLYYTRSRGRLKSYAKKAGLDPEIGLHDLRRTFATTLHQNGEDMAVISRLMGHADISTTINHYAFTSDDQKRAAIANLHY